jgi:hypothetical protein
LQKCSFSEPYRLHVGVNFFFIRAPELDAPPDPSYHHCKRLTQQIYPKRPY